MPQLQVRRHKLDVGRFVGSRRQQQVLLPEHRADFVELRLADLVNPPAHDRGRQLRPPPPSHPRPRARGRETPAASSGSAGGRRANPASLAGRAGSAGGSARAAQTLRPRPSRSRRDFQKPIAGDQVALAVRHFQAEPASRRSCLITRRKNPRRAPETPPDRPRRTARCNASSVNGSPAVSGESGSPRRGLVIIDWHYRKSTADCQGDELPGRGCRNPSLRPQLRSTWIPDRRLL